MNRWSLLASKLAGDMYFHLALQKPTINPALTPVAYKTKSPSYCPLGNWAYARIMADMSKVKMSSKFCGQFWVYPKPNSYFNDILISPIEE